MITVQGECDTLLYDAPRFTVQIGPFHSKRYWVEANKKGADQFENRSAPSLTVLIIRLVSGIECHFDGGSS